MDQELIAYFDARFRELSRQISESREETAQQIEKVREETSQQIADLREESTHQIATFHEETTWRFEQVDKRFEQIDSRFGQVDDRFEQVGDRFDQTDSHFEKIEETTRHTSILVEGLRHQVHLVAESVLGTNDKLERYRGETVDGLDRIIGLIEPYYRDLDGRIRDLNGRTHVLENRAERQQGDVMDAIRKMLGKPPLSPPVTSE